MTRWISYSLIRLGIFTAIFVLLMALSLTWWVSALLATVIAFTLSYIFFYRQRAELAKDLENRLKRRRNVDPDSQSEDDALDSEGDGNRENDSKNQ
jgi:Ca2+/Na+ antiporter